MISSGIRLGASDYLKWKHVAPIVDDEEMIIAVLRLTGQSIHMVSKDLSL